MPSIAVKLDVSSPHTTRDDLRRLTLDSASTFDELISAVQTVAHAAWRADANHQQRYGAHPDVKLVMPSGRCIDDAGSWSNIKYDRRTNANASSSTLRLRAVPVSKVQSPPPSPQPPTQLPNASSTSAQGSSVHETDDADASGSDFEMVDGDAFAFVVVPSEECKGIPPSPPGGPISSGRAAAEEGAGSKETDAVAETRAADAATGLESTVPTTCTSTLHEESSAIEPVEVHTKTAQEVDAFAALFETFKPSEPAAPQHGRDHAENWTEESSNMHSPTPAPTPASVGANAEAGSDDADEVAEKSPTRSADTAAAAAAELVLSLLIKNFGTIHGRKPRSAKEKLTAATQSIAMLKEAVGVAHTNSGCRPTGGKVRLAQLAQAYADLLQMHWLDHVTIDGGAEQAHVAERRLLNKEVEALVNSVGTPRVPEVQHWGASNSSTIICATA